VVKKVVTDAKSLADIKNPAEDNVFKLYSLVATIPEIEEMRANYLAGGYGYGHAKNALHAVLVREFKEEREKFEHYMNNTEELEQKLQEGEAKAEVIAKATIQRIRKKMNLDD
jgi:tryptophanyl-tRNA synthetase